MSQATKIVVGTVSVSSVLAILLMAALLLG